MEDFKSAWGITRNWQLAHPILGILLAVFFGFLITNRILSLVLLSTFLKMILTLFSTLLWGYLIILLSLFCFKKLKNRWQLDARWQFIAVFIVFAITGSLAGRLSNPLMDFMGLAYENTSGWMYWPLRILLIFPIYQILLLAVGWLFGQYSFFYAFEKKMLSRLGLGFLFR